MSQQSLMHSQRLFLLDDVQYLNIPVFDHDTMRLGQLKRSVSWMHEQRDAGRGVLVHCALGQGRSVAVVAWRILKTLDPARSYEVLLDGSASHPQQRPTQSQANGESDLVRARWIAEAKTKGLHDPQSGHAGLAQSEEDLILIHQLLDEHMWTLK
jgi:hypothetical protein